MHLRYYRHRGAKSSAELRTCAVGLNDHGAGLPEVRDAALQVLPFAQQAQPLQALPPVGNLWDVHYIQAPCPSVPPLWSHSITHTSSIGIAAMLRCHIADKTIDFTNIFSDQVKCKDMSQPGEGAW